MQSFIFNFEKKNECMNETILKTLLLLLFLISWGYINK